MDVAALLTQAGLNYAAEVVAECERYGVKPELIATLAQMESSRREPDGRVTYAANVYGHDADACMTVIGAQVAVTQPNYQAYQACVAAGGKRNGVGPLQITYVTLQQRGDDLGGLWRPEISIRVGVEHFANLLRSPATAQEAATAGKPVEWAAYRRYNGGNTPTPRSVSYADRAMALLSTWTSVVTGAKPEEPLVTVMPGADYRPINYTGVPKMTRHDIVCLHTIVGNDPAPAAHFSVRGNGWLTQSRDTQYQSAANYQGNPRVIAIETDDFGPEFGTWNVNDGHAVPAWTQEQVESIVVVLVWCHKTHGIPLVLAPDSKPTSRGIAYHRMGVDGNWAGYAYGGRVTGGETWTTSPGKVCPGDRRIKQLIEIVIPRARVLAGLQQETNVTTPLAVWAYEMSYPPYGTNTQAGTWLVTTRAATAQNRQVLDAHGVALAEIRALCNEILEAVTTGAGLTEGWEERVTAASVEAAERGAREGARDGVTADLLAALANLQQQLNADDAEQALEAGRAAVAELTAKLTEAAQAERPPGSTAYGYDAPPRGGT